MHVLNLLTHKVPAGHKDTSKRGGGGYRENRPTLPQLPFFAWFGPCHSFIACVTVKRPFSGISKCYTNVTIVHRKAIGNKKTSQTIWGQTLMTS